MLSSTVNLGAIQVARDSGSRMALACECSERVMLPPDVCLLRSGGEEEGEDSADGVILRDDQSRSLMSVQRFWQRPSSSSISAEFFLDPETDVFGLAEVIISPAFFAISNRKSWTSCK